MSGDCLAAREVADGPALLTRLRDRIAAREIERTAFVAYVMSRFGRSGVNCELTGDQWRRLRDLLREEPT